MDGRRFRALLEELNSLSSEQRQRLSVKLSEIEADSPLDVVDSAEGKPVCPDCESNAVIRYGCQDGLQTFKCKACGRRFNRLSKTPLSRLRHRDKWRKAVEAIEQKSTLSQMQANLEICRDTAHRWRHRFLKTLEHSGNPKLSGIVEADETFIRVSHKGKRKGMERERRKRGGQSKTKGLSLEEYHCVWIARDRTKNTAHAVSMHRDTFILKRFLEPLIAKGSVLCTDGKKGYAKFTRKKEEIQHVVLNQSKGERVKDSIYHIQNVNNYHSRLKAWLASFNGVSTKHLTSYLDWFRYSSGLKENLFKYDPDRFFKFSLNPS